MRDERGSSILEYLIAGLIFFVVIFTVPLLIHGAQDYGAMANAERVAMHQEEVDGYYSACASMRLRDALQGANLPANLVSVVSATSRQQQYGQPVDLAVRYVYQPFSWLSIPLTVSSQAVSQYTPGETSGGGCPPPANGTVATGPGSPATVTIHANPNPANVGQQVTFSGEALDQYGNPVAANVTVSGGGQSATVYAQGGYYSAVLTFGSPGTFTVWAAAGGASASTQETVQQPLNCPDPVVTAVVINYDPNPYNYYNQPSGEDTSFTIYGSCFGTLPSPWFDGGNTSPINADDPYVCQGTYAHHDTPWTVFADTTGHLGGQPFPWSFGYTPSTFGNPNANGSCGGLWIASWTPEKIVISQLGNGMSYGWELWPGDAIGIRIANPQSGVSTTWHGTVP